MSIPKHNRREALESVRPTRENRKMLILSAMKNGNPGGMTAEEITDILYSIGKISSTDRNSVKPRLTEMYKGGIVAAVGRRKSPTTGRSTTVWKAVDS